MFVKDMKFLDRNEKELLILDFIKELEKKGVLNFTEEGLHSYSESFFHVLSATSIFEDYAFVKIESEESTENIKDAKLLSLKEKDIFLNGFMKDLVNKKIVDIFDPEFGFDYNKLSVLEASLMFFDKVCFFYGIEQPWYTD